MTEQPKRPLPPEIQSSLKSEYVFNIKTFKLEDLKHIPSS